MPSPFPGMDPYLEARNVFRGVHVGLVVCLCERIQPRLPEPYYADMGHRTWVEPVQCTTMPDVVIERAPGRGKGTAAVATPTEPRAVVVTVPHDEFREPFLEIYTNGDRLVTTVEVLSPGNKARGGKARDLYLRKQRELVEDSQVHLVEIDLLRYGEHTTAVPLEEARRRTGPFDYHVCVHRYHRFEDFEVYPIRLRDRLPEIAIPLLPEDPDVQIRLQAVFDRAYDTGPYRRRIDYRGQVEPPLGEDEARWVEGLLKEKGLR